VKIGCALPFAGSQMLMGQAILVGLKMAVTDFAAKTLPGVDVNLTCLDSKCREVSAFNAMNRLADEQAGGCGLLFPSFKCVISKDLGGRQ
jgi:ABC-type branched-subunit amino acid transport system substrate-binding protein